MSEIIKNILVDKKTNSLIYNNITLIIIFIILLIIIVIFIYNYWTLYYCNKKIIENELFQCKSPKETY